MLRPALALALALALASLAHAFAFDSGRYSDVDPKIRQWFRNQKSPAGIFCCDVADGHRTSWRGGKSGYEVFIEDQWVPVPPDAVILHSGNPTGESIVWYWHLDGKPWISCFVPGAGS